MSVVAQLDQLHKSWRTAGDAAQFGGEPMDAYQARDTFGAALVDAWPDVRAALEVASELHLVCEQPHPPEKWASVVGAWVDCGTCLSCRHNAALKLVFGGRA